PDWNWKRFFTAASSDGMCRDYMNHLRRNMSRLSSSGRLALIRFSFVLFYWRRALTGDEGRIGAILKRKKRTSFQM
ncbi:hypothetical protein, partial [Geomonas sp. Red276]